MLDDSGLIPRTQIVSAQRTWVAFRDAECDFRTSVSGGAHQWLIVNHAQCLAELTEQRTKVLDDYLKRAQDEWASACRGRLIEVGINAAKLGYVRMGEIEKAVALLRNEWACMPGTSQDQGYTMAQLKADFDKYVKEFSN
ncbi:lysozyme inhibitor LprI family protein [Burkholderia ubonensis]|uniref:lysozyme inhibitor LprI family protein n=1 Tax=Burkholderia ubonensis TaxID=101571 RepID=UPI0018DFEE7A|nr:lysozyme inhibitor LprI family protein [Burkholderia ubonensis]